MCLVLWLMRLRRLHILSWYRKQSHLAQVRQSHIPRTGSVCFSRMGWVDRQLFVWTILGSSVSSFSVWAMAVLKGVISLYWAGEEKPIERYKARIASCQHLKTNLIDFLGLNDQAKKVRTRGHLTWNSTTLWKSAGKREKLLYVSQR